MARNRKQPPKIVEWAQERILQRLLQVLGQGGQFSHSSTNPSSTDKGVAVREIRKQEELILLSQIMDEMKIMNLHLSLLTENTFKPGDS